MNSTTAVPKLVLHLDVNKTLVAMDSAGGKDVDEVIQSLLAERCVFKWSEGHESMSYYDFVKRVLVPGSSTDGDVKKKRREYHRSFLTMLAEHPQRSELESTYKVTETYHKLRKALDASSRPGGLLVFESFFRLVEWLDAKQHAYTLVLRTFGDDLPELATAIFTRNPKLTFRPAHFTEGSLTLDEYMTDSYALSKQVVGSDVQDLWEAFTETRTHLAVKDHHAWWHSHDEGLEYGKIFPYAPEQTDHLSLFFDDNIVEKEIVYPVTTSGETGDIKELVEKRLFQVDTLEAISDPQYFVNKVKCALQAQAALVQGV